MAEHGLTAADLIAKTPNPRASTSGRKVAAKYRDPASGQTWTGRGLKPKWLSAALEPGPAEALMDWSAVEPSRSPLQILCASYLVQLEQHPVTPSL